MYYERKFEFQIAARKRAAGNPTRRACSLAVKHLPGSATFFVARTDPTPSDRRDGSPLTPNTSRAASHGFQIVTPRLEFPATVTKQSLGYISNRYKNAVFSSGFSALARNGPEPSPSEFLIANKHDFSVGCGRSRLRAPESLFVCRNLSSENRSTILAGRLKMIISAIRRTLVKVKSLLCYGDSHFQLWKMITDGPNDTFGEN